MSIGPEIISVVAILSCIALPTYLLFRWCLFRDQQRTLRAMLEKGIQIPSEMFLTSPTKNPVNDLRCGLLLICSSIGLTISLFMMSDMSDIPHLWSIGLIPFFLGTGYVAGYGAACADPHIEKEPKPHGERG